MLRAQVLILRLMLELDQTRTERDHAVNVGCALMLKAVNSREECHALRAENQRLRRLLGDERALRAIQDA